MADPEITLFQNAQNVTITDSEILVVGGDYIQNIYITEQIPPLPPLRPSSALFTGREAYLQALKDCFSPKQDSQRKKYLLYGKGGIGKTQICLKFIEKYGKKWFSDIFWIGASSEDAIDLCLKQIAKKHVVDSAPSAEAALEWISGRSGWLMVFDNADGGYQVVEKFLPFGNEGSILVTSRNKALQRITSSAHSLEVIEMGEEEAVTLLLKSSGIDSNAMDIAIATKRLVALLGGIPLAIDQAGAYMQSCNCGLDHYLELYVKHRAKLMSDGEFTGASLYNHSTYGTWEISIGEIKCRAEGKNGVQNVAAQSALILHGIFAFLNYDNISAEIFEKAAENFMKRKGEKTNGLPQSISFLDSKVLFLSEDGNWDMLLFLAGIKLLLSFSLIRNYEMLYFVHPLIQAWSRDRLPAANASGYCQLSRSLLACSFNLGYNKDNYRFCILLAPHIKANNEHIAQWISDELYYDDENERFGLVFYKIGNWGQAEKIWNQTLNEREARLAPHHPSTLGAMINVAVTYSKLGKWEEAEGLHLQVMELRREKLGPLHPSTLNAMGNLAATYSMQRKWKEAKSLQVQVMEASKEKLGPLHPSTLTAMNNLAITYNNQGEWEAAVNLQVQLMKSRKEELGPLHPGTFTAMNNLATTYTRQGNWAEAEGLQLQVMESRKEVLGPLHPSTLGAMSNLATTYNNQGKWEEARSLRVQVKEASNKELGPLHPFTLTAMNNLAITYSDQGKWDKAQDLQLQVMEARKIKLGLFHPDTLTIMNNLSSTFGKQGKWKEAESLRVQVVESRKERLGLLHPDTLTAMSNLATSYSNQGKWEEAVSMHAQVMESRKERFGPLHPSTLIAMGNLATTYSNQGKWKEAEPLQIQVMEASKGKLGSLHHFTLTAMGNLAITYSNQKRWKKAESLLIEVIGASKRKLGPFHPDTLTLMSNLATTYENQGKWTEAKRLQVQVIEAKQQSSD